MVAVKISESETLSLNLNPSTTTLRSLQRNYLIPVGKKQLYLHKKCLSTSKNAFVLLSRLGVSPDSTLTLRVQSRRFAKAAIAKRLHSRPKSVKLWMQAAKLEPNIVNRIRVLKEGLGFIPRSAILWKAVVELANDQEEDARLLLRRAVKSCPLHVEFWLGLARLETYENASKLLRKARKKLSKEQPAIWIAAAKLEETNKGSTSVVGKIVKRGIRALQRQGLEIDRVSWMKEAKAAERAGLVATCQAIVRNIIRVGVEEEQDWKRTWVADAEECEMKGLIETARAIYANALTLFSTKKSIWLKAVHFEKSHGTRESLDALLREAVTWVPHAEVLWLMSAEEKWLGGDVSAARAILQEACDAVPNSEEIWLAAFKLEFKNNEPERARMLLDKAREMAGTKRVWMKSSVFERELGNTEEEMRLLDEGLKLFPSFFKLWLMRGQLEERLKNLNRAMETYELGLNHCSSCIPLWISLALLEEKVNGLRKARAVLAMAREKNPQSPELWLAAVKAEARHGWAYTLMTKALQEFPTSGLLWAASIGIVPQPQRGTQIRDAYRSSSGDPYVLAAVGKIYWHQRKFYAARSWFDRAVTLSPDIGDFWALRYKFELEHGTDESQMDVLNRCVAAKPKHGEMWQAVSKAVGNWHQATEVILKEVVVALENKSENGMN